MRLENVWLRYHRRGPWVLRDAAIGIAPGEAAIVQGRNGAGKSTLLQLAAGVLRPTRGRVVERPTVVGWVPERFPADQPFDVHYYLVAMGRMAGLTPVEAGRAVDHWTERLGLARFRRVRLPELSKGTAQKVGLAQAMLRPPGLLVLDEPWEGLDASSRELVPELIDEVLADGGSVLVSDHRGETVRLPGARRWTVAAGEVDEVAPTEGQAYAVVEIAVPAAQVAGTVTRLRADGHRVLGVHLDRLGATDGAGRETAAAEGRPGDAPVPDPEPPDVAVSGSTTASTASGGQVAR
ncbi:ATP-binding cassette domain-containing protein [Micromonospora musae]|uniref:ATP-binding cassette domain-containing protein n=1 Tax=Micromonospora musae TaxID=1894970 RepID=A0ABX9QSI3_9ACTN|nr:ATP-binding cassette domain-containing protein [Micromonospora musae]RKN13356.1 ATP-binding cassette domain-containing protein [Micromonospora musae]